MTSPGIPCVYYGSEVGLSGGSDPQNRRAYPWDQDQWNMNLFNFYKNITSIRNAHKSLQSGSFQFVSLTCDRGSHVFGFTRTFAENEEEEVSLVIFNDEDTPVTIHSISFNIPRLEDPHIEVLDALDSGLNISMSKTGLVEPFVMNARSAAIFVL